MLVERLETALKDATKNQDTVRRATLRLIMAAIKDKQIQERGDAEEGADNSDALDDAGVTALLQKMVKQRQDSIEKFRAGGRDDLVDREQQEVGIIQEFLPKLLSEEEQSEAIRTAIEETGAESIRDMGRVIAALKAAHPGQLDIAKASDAIKAQLT